MRKSLILDKLVVLETIAEIFAENFKNTGVRTCTTLELKNALIAKGNKTLDTQKAVSEFCKNLKEGKKLNALKFKKGDNFITYAPVVDLESQSRTQPSLLKPFVVKNGPELILTYADAPSRAKAMAIKQLGKLENYNDMRAWKV